jgi:DNA-binding response OmpR family regulator
MKILVVEDELKMASLLLRGFRNNGDVADVTRTGEDAVWMTAATNYDAVVLDVMLPGMDGFETLAKLRESDCRPRRRRRRLLDEAVLVRGASGALARDRPSGAR